MSDPGGGKRHKLSTQEVLNSIWDETTEAIKVYMEAGVTINPGDIQIGAVELKNHDTDDRALIDTDHYLHVRAVQRLQNGGSPVDISDSNPMPTTITDPPLGFSGGVWHFSLDAETLGLMSLLSSQLDIPLTDLESQLSNANSELSSINNHTSRDEGWKTWNGTSDALPANTVGLTMTNGGLIQHQILISNDEVAPSVRTIEYSFDGGVTWMALKPGETRSIEGVFFETWKLRSGDASGGEAYRAEAFTEA